MPAIWSLTSSVFQSKNLGYLLQSNETCYLRAPRCFFSVRLLSEHRPNCTVITVHTSSHLLLLFQPDLCIRPLSNCWYTLKNLPVHLVFTSPSSSSGCLNSFQASHVIRLLLARLMPFKLFLLNSDSPSSSSYKKYALRNTFKYLLH